MKKKPKPGRKTAEKRSAAPRATRRKGTTRKRGTDETAAGCARAEAEQTQGFPVVGIGASAGGLEALQEFFSNLPDDTGCAFVVVTHMHREHTSMLPELLAKTTVLPVVEASQGQAVERNRVYVAPPGDHLTIEAGVLRRSDHSSDVRLPIDHFLRALATDQREHAICVILSGTGTDGTLGLRAVKSEAGMAMVQKPQSAKFAGMPASAEGTGLVDYLLPPAEMPAQLVAYVDELRTRIPVPKKAEPEFPAEALQQILGTLRMRTGNDFSSYKLNTIRRRIERRMNVHRIQSPREYARYLKQNKHEANLLFRELLITVTSFFRDPGAFSALAECLTEELGRRAEGDGVRIWVPGCATGEEAYSIAIVLHEILHKLERPSSVQVFATDLDPRAVEVARAGMYTTGIAADVTPARLARYFTQDHDSYRINKEIRELVIFAPQNVVSDPPFTRLDVIVCRNLLIYFDALLQKQLVPTLHYALRPGGILFLGTSETIGPLDELFEVIDRKWKIYRRRETHVDVRPAVFALAARGVTGARADDRPLPEKRPRAILPRTEGQIQRLLLRRFAPTCLVVEGTGNIVYVQGRAGLYLEPTEGEPTHNVLEMAREGLATPLAAAMRQALKQPGEVTRANVSVRTNSEYTRVDLAVTAIDEPESLRGLLLVTLRPSADKPTRLAAKIRAARDKERGGRLAELEEELRHSQESLQSTVEELESANEELRSANEELQSMNEELQSANEELETSKEEMQSLNEELSTVNAELHLKVEELSHANDDMQNLLNGIDVATVFLDQRLRIKRYTEQARNLIHLVPSDVGRPLADLALHVEHPDLVDECQQVLRALERREQQVRASDGKWLLMRILPYRTSNNVIDGIVVTFMPIDELKRAEQQAHDARQYFEKIVETVREPLVVLDGELNVCSANEAFVRTFQVSAAEIVGSQVYDLGDGQWSSSTLRRLLEEVIPQNESFSDFEVEHEFPRLGRRRFLLNARRMEFDCGRRRLILLAMEDVTGSGP